MTPSARRTAAACGAVLALALVGVPRAAVAASGPATPAALAALNYSPTSRTVAPAAVQGTTGSVLNPQNVLGGTATRISGTNSSITLDFGKEVGGIGTLSFGSTSDASQSLGLAFTESSQFIGLASDASSGGNPDGALVAAATPNGSYTMPTARLRGGFRYLTVFLRTAGWVDLKSVSLAFTPAPGKANPAAYPNYFYSSDDQLNRIWYAGAYTVQTNIIASNQGRAWPPPTSEWDNSATVGVGAAVLVDGAKRDRTVWPGDMGIAVPTGYAALDELDAARNSLSTMYSVQDPSGEIPWSGPAFNLKGSDTYHTWTLLGTSLYYTYSADRAWLDSIWGNYTRGMSFILGKVDANSLLNVTATRDWARDGQGGENIEANALLYAALTGGATLARVEGDATLAASYDSRASAIKAAANTRLWDAAAGLYRDNPTSSLYPQDGNSLAVWYGLIDSQAKGTTIAAHLTSRWNAFGGTTPEWGGGVHPFAGGMELNAHFAVNDDEAALTQIRRTWGYMLDSPLGTKSTFWEGINADGGLAYGGSFMSMSHGWSSAPTSALTFNVLGTAPDTQVGQYRFIPHPGDLASAEGRITLPQGPLIASWSRDAAAGTFASTLTSPAGTMGRIGIPTFGGATVSVSVNGAVVWSNGAFTARPGISGASQDGSYVYLTGVAPGTYSVSASGLGTSSLTVLPTTPLPAGFTYCAAEAGQCSFTGTRIVAFGAGTYVYKALTAGTACTSTAFGADPVSNVAKACYAAPTGGPTGFTQCSPEAGTCTVSGAGRTIAYGANGAFNTRVVSSNTSCSNAVFGDPLPTVVKACYLGPPGAPGVGWTQCAAETGACATTNGALVAYGAFGGFRYGYATGPATACTSVAFGVDPALGAVKGCYTFSGSPPGYATACAAEAATCTITGTRTVAYGARGAFVYKSFQAGAVPCTTASFGIDPLYGVQKSCFLTP